MAIPFHVIIALVSISSVLLLFFFHISHFLDFISFFTVYLDLFVSSICFYYFYLLLIGEPDEGEKVVVNWRNNRGFFQRAHSK